MIVVKNIGRIFLSSDQAVCRDEDVVIKPEPVSLPFFGQMQGSTPGIVNDIVIECTVPELPGITGIVPDEYSRPGCRHQSVIITDAIVDTVVMPAGCAGILKNAESAAFILISETVSYHRMSDAPIEVKASSVIGSFGGAVPVRDAMLYHYAIRFIGPDADGSIAYSGHIPAIVGSGTPVDGYCPAIAGYNATATMIDEVGGISGIIISQAIRDDNMIAISFAISTLQGDAGVSILISMDPGDPDIGRLVDINAGLLKTADEQAVEGNMPAVVDRQPVLLIPVLSAAAGQLQVSEGNIAGLV